VAASPAARCATPEAPRAASYTIPRDTTQARRAAVFELSDRKLSQCSPWHGVLPNFRTKALVRNDSRQPFRGRPNPLMPHLSARSAAWAIARNRPPLPFFPDQAVPDRLGSGRTLSLATVRGLLQWARSARACYALPARAAARAGRRASPRRHWHFEKPQAVQVMQPSIMAMAYWPQAGQAGPRGASSRPTACAWGRT